VKEAEVSASGEETRPDAPVTPRKQDGQLVLIVDDEENIRNLLFQELIEAGYRVIQAADGETAIARARSEKPDLITLDVIMPPGIGGLEVVSELKADPATSAIPILVLSIMEDEEKVLRMGADGYLTKPLDIDKLLESVAVLLAHPELSGRVSAGVESL
jgi:DNA-binding response OmpR family regulator